MSYTKSGGKLGAGDVYRGTMSYTKSGGKFGVGDVVGKIFFYSP